MASTEAEPVEINEETQPMHTQDISTNIENENLNLADLRIQNKYLKRYLESLNKDTKNEILKRSKMWES